MYRAYLRTDIVESSNNGEDLADAVEAVAGSACNLKPQINHRP